MAADPADRVTELRLSRDRIDDAELPRLEVAVRTPHDGAIVSFVGRAREDAQADTGATTAGAGSVALDYDTDEAGFRRVFAEIAGEIDTRFGVRRVAGVHRVGDVPPGDITVAVSVAAPHRDAAFDACRYVIDQLKSRAPVGKVERPDAG